MSSSNIENLIQKDLDTLLYHKSLKGEISVNIAIEIAAYVAAKFLRIIFAKNKEILPQELNGIFGIISNIYKVIFNDQLELSDYQKISTMALYFLKDADFDSNCKNFFNNIIQ